MREASSCGTTVEISPHQIYQRTKQYKNQWQQGKQVTSIFLPHFSLSAVQIQFPGNFCSNWQPWTPQQLIRMSTPELLEVTLPCTREPPDCQYRRGSQLAGECWSCGNCFKAHFKNKFECMSAAEAVLTRLVKFPCTRPSTKSCDLKALTKDERDSMERPFISVWYLSIMDHLPCSKIRRRTSLQCKKQNHRPSRAV